MARITIEDCMEQVPNRFHLVRMASVRAKQLKKGALPLLTSEDNKHVVMALREIAAALVKPGDVESSTADAGTVVGPNLEAVQAEEVQTEEVAPTVDSGEPTATSES